MSMMSRMESTRRDRRSGRNARRRRRVAIVPESPTALEDRCLLSVYTVTSLGDDGGAGTLRSIIELVNSDSTPDTIDFSLPGSAPYVIQPTSALPEITNSVTIDGTSQPGYAGQPIVEINGGQAGSFFVDGLELNADNVTVQGLIIDGFSNNGIEIAGGNGDLIQGNDIGTDNTGTVADPNSDDGITIDTTSYDTIGGTTAAARNIISGNDAKGIDFIFGTNTGIVVEGNYIGTDVTGTQPLGNHANGIDMFANSTNITIGGPAAGAGNVIASNSGQGIEIFGGGEPNTLIEGNDIGTNATGAAGLGNGQWGINSGSANETILDNVISGNSSGGIQAYGSGTVIQGNDIGTDPSGTMNLGNLGPGVEDSGSNIQVGGLGAGQGNVIAFNGNIWYGPLSGVNVDPGQTSDPILSNSIFDNARLGIDLNNDGVTPNHPGGPVPGGANYDQNYPVLQDALTYGGSTIIIGSFNSAANSTYTLQFFDNPTPDPLGYGQGQTLIGTTTVTTDSSGNASFQVSFPTTVNAGDAISATATDCVGRYVRVRRGRVGRRAHLAAGGQQR